MNRFPALYEPYKSILRYFFPEFIVALVVYTMVGLIDATCVAHLHSTACYATLGVANVLTMFIHKVAEGVSVGAVIICGQYQGQKNYDMVGKAAVAALWVAAALGSLIAAFLYLNTERVCHWLNIPEAMMAECIPFLKLRALGIACMFLFLSLVGFLRGVKNTRAVMYFFVLGALVFIFFDYALIFGMFGFTAWGFQGSAAAFALQYVVMFCAALLYILFKPDYKIYHFNLFRSSWSLIKSIGALSWPVTFDKAALQIERLWMVRLIAPMGSYALGSMNVIKDMESLAFVPAIAFGHVVTLMVSNEFGAHHFAAIKKLIKIIVALATGMVGALFIFFVLHADTIMGIFDRQHAFTKFASKAFPIVGLLIFFDLFQVILAGALRGTANVKLVMWVRVFSALIIFIPASYGISLFAFENPVVRFIALYGSFNIVNGFTSIIYTYWFSSGRWLKVQQIIPEQAP